MPEHPSATPPEPAIRFSVKTMLANTALAAIVAAVAAAFWKRQTLDVQLDLAAFWGSLLVGIGPAGWISWREISRRRLDAGTVFYIPPTTSRFRLVNLINRSQFLRLAGCALPFFMFIVWHSHTISNQGASDSSMLWASLRGLTASFMVCIPIQLLLRQKIALGPNGISWGAGYAPWNYIRHAEWLGDRPGTMKLRRLDGDIYLDVPAELRSGVEEFVRSKTAFVGGGGGAKN